jgi:hypothetical protein
MAISTTRKRLANNRDFLSWHGAKSLKIEESDPATFGEN